MQSYFYRINFNVRLAFALIIHSIVVIDWREEM